MERKTANDYPQDLLNLFDTYVHGEIDLPRAHTRGVLMIPLDPHRVVVIEFWRRASRHQTQGHYRRSAQTHPPHAAPTSS